MTIHPEADDLGRFVEGRLSDTERREIVAHIADCDECRILIVDSAEFIEPTKTESHKWRLEIAASLMLVTAIGALTFNHFRNPLASVEKTFGQVANRPLEARISGFPYAPRQTMRGPGDGNTDPASMILKDKASELTDLSGSDAKTLHARGIGLLLSEDDPKPSIAPLQAAGELDPNNAEYQSDVAAALIAAARGNRQMLEGALAACDHALSIDSNSPDALFNRALALQALERPEAIAAYDRYLAVDPSSPWADEIRRHRDGLRPLP